MKYWILLLFPIQSWALTCIDSASALQAAVYKDKENIHFEFQAGRGYSSIPQFEGPVSLDSLPIAKFQFNELKELGDHFSVDVPASACDLSKAEQGIFACYKQGPIKGTKYNYSSLTGFRVKQSHVSGDFDMQYFRLMIGNEDVFFFSVPFALEKCMGKL